MPRPRKKENIVADTKKKISKVVGEYPEIEYYSQELLANCSPNSGRGGVGNANTSVSTAANSLPIFQYNNLSLGINPCYAGAGTYGGQWANGVGMSWVMNLCMLAYYNVPIVNSTINLQADFSRSPIYFSQGNEQSRKFFSLWAKKINLWNLQKQFFVNYYGPANVPILRLNSTFQKSELLNKSDTLYAKFAEKNGVELTAEKVKGISVRYWFLNPALLYINSYLSYYNPTYSLMISPNDLKELQNPLSKSDKLWVKNLDIDLKQLQKTTPGAPNVLIPLTPENFMIVFNNKMDYQPFAMPALFPVLNDIDAKLELKNLDRMMARWLQQAILHVKLGKLDNPGKPLAPSPNQSAQMQQMLSVGSVGKVIVTDNLVDIDFKLPNIGNILDPKKYEELDQDIRQGLGNILFGDGEKFANSEIKMEVFLSRLKDGRKTFLNDFLIPEMQRIGEILNFKSIPEPIFEDADFKDSVNFGRIAAQLGQLGILTPEGVITALKTGRLPTEEENIESQRKYRDLKENEDLFDPIVMQKDEQIDEEKTTSKQKNPNGRPSGTKGIKQSVPRKTGRIGRNAAASYQFDPLKIVEYTELSSQLESQIISYIKEKVGKKKLTKEQLSLIPIAAEIIMVNEEPENWLESVKKYVDLPKDTNLARVLEVESVAAEHNQLNYNAAILFAARIKE